MTRDRAIIDVIQLHNDRAVDCSWYRKASDVLKALGIKQEEINESWLKLLNEDCLNNEENNLRELEMLLLE